MTDNDNATRDAPATDHDKLRQLFTALLDTLLREVLRPDVKASVLEVARMFLRQNGITANSRTDLRAGLASLRDMPFSS